ncbi:MAG: STAS domain-containing protein [Acidimicrobiales bacterium]|nr:STAS domain-containing protein [Acidimicrobiales bacterium]HRW39500.1 STAS domain-containing protein [Aquihabitans sp.]
MSTFSIEASCDAVALRLACVGELDAAATCLLADAVRAHEAAGSGRVVLDLARTTFIDSSGIATIVKLSRSLREHDVHLELVRAGRTVRRAFELCGLLHLLELDPAPS